MTNDTNNLSRFTHDQDTVHNTTSLLKAMANENRLRILAGLSEGGEMSVGDLQDFLGSLSQSALSQHLAVLRSTGLVQTRRESQTIYYSINSQIPGAVMAVILQNGQS